MTFKHSIFLITTFALLFTNDAFSQWLEISNTTIKKEFTEQAGPEIVIEYDLESNSISEKTPAYVFLQISDDDGIHWNLVPIHFLRGNGYDIVSSAGHKKISWWGIEELGYGNLETKDIKVRGIQMVKIPGGEFIMKAYPGGGKDPTAKMPSDTSIEEFFIAKNETTISMYADYLNDRGIKGIGWNNKDERQP